MKLGGRACDGALAHATLAVCNSDDLFDVWDAALWWEPAIGARHASGTL